MTLDTQLMTMIVMMSGGTFVGFSLETYRRLFFKIKKYHSLNYLFESLFWLTQTAILFYLLYRVNEGQLRFYILLAGLLGYSIYKVMFRHLYQRLLEAMIIACKTIVLWMIQAVQILLIQPVLWFVRGLFWLVLFIWRFIIRLMLIPFRWLLWLGKKLIPDKYLKKITKLYMICSTMVNKQIRMVKYLFRKWRK